MGVDGRPGIVARRLGAAALLGTPGFRWRREPRNLDLEFAPVARREFWGLGVERLTWDRAHGPSLLLASKRNIDALLEVLVGEGEEPSLEPILPGLGAQPDLFAHWRFGARPDGWRSEPDESRGPRPALRALGVRVRLPPATHPTLIVPPRQAPAERSDRGSGIEAARRVPLPGGLSTSSRPSSTASQSASPTSPVPSALAPHPVVAHFDAEWDCVDALRAYTRSNALYDFHRLMFDMATRPWRLTLRFIRESVVLEDVPAVALLRAERAERQRAPVLTRSRLRMLGRRRVHSQ